MLKCKLCESSRANTVTFKLKTGSNNVKDVTLCESCTKTITKQTVLAALSDKSIQDINSKKKKALKHPEWTAAALNLINEKLGKKKRYKPDNVPDSALTLVSARVEDGHSFEDIELVINHKAEEWIGDRMQKYFRFATLFAKSKFEQYLEEAPERLRGQESIPPQYEVKYRRLLTYAGKPFYDEQAKALTLELLESGYYDKKSLRVFMHLVPEPVQKGKI